MSTENNSDVKIVNPELSINKKLGNIKFEQAFDEGTITRAEKVVTQNEETFKNETAKDFSTLKRLVPLIDEHNLDSEIYNRLSEVAFSIKSRAGTGGHPLASDVANSMFKFCDEAAEILPPNGFKCINLHYNALAEIFEGGFDINDKNKCFKLVSGLEEISSRFLGK